MIRRKSQLGMRDGREGEMAAFGRRPGGLNSGGLKSKLSTPASGAQGWETEREKEPSL